MFLSVFTMSEYNRMGKNYGIVILKDGIIGIRRGTNQTQNHFLDVLNYITNQTEEKILYSGWDLKGKRDKIFFEIMDLHGTSMERNGEKLKSLIDKLNELNK